MEKKESPSSEDGSKWEAFWQKPEDVSGIVLEHAITNGAFLHRPWPRVMDFLQRRHAKKPLSATHIGRALLTCRDLVTRRDAVTLFTTCVGRFSYGGLGTLCTQKPEVYSRLLSQLVSIQAAPRALAPLMQRLLCPPLLPLSRESQQSVWRGKRRAHCDADILAALRHEPMHLLLYRDPCKAMVAAAASVHLHFLFVMPPEDTLQWLASALLPPAGWPLLDRCVDARPELLQCLQRLAREGSVEQRGHATAYCQRQDA